MTEDNNSNKKNKSVSELTDADPGIAGRITRQFINSPVTPLLMVMFLAIGLLGLFFTPRQEDPKISVPMVDIFVQYPGASSEQVASLVTEPMERLMSEIPGIRHVYSATQRGTSMVTVRFKVGEDLGQSIVKVYDKLQSNLDLIPPGVSPPLVKPVGIDDVSVVTVTLWSKNVDDSALRTLALDVLQRLKEVPNTGKGFVVGGRSEQVRVEVMPERLEGYGVTMDQIARTISAANSEQAAGNVEGGNTAFSVYTGAFMRDALDVERLIIGISDGVPVYMRDVANVYQAPEETRQLVSYYSGPAAQSERTDRVNRTNQPQAYQEPAVTIAIAKKIGSNGVTVANALIDKLDSLRGQLIPDNVYAEVTRDYGKTADDKVNELLMALFEAAVAVSILCLIGLGLRAASVVITIIPIVILITVWSAWVLDYTIDRVSLFALVFSIGILVDDATVVVENIFRRWLEAGKTTTRIAVDAVREVGNPTILATLTIVFAMLPMGFVSGLMGPYMRPIPVLGASAMFFSLIAAFVFAPWFAMRVRPRLVALKKAEERETRFRKKISNFYLPCILPLCTNRKLGLGFLFGLIIATFLAFSLFYTKTVAVKMLPFDNKPEFNVVINMPEGIALPVTANVTARLVDALYQIPEVTALQTYVGTASPYNFNGMVRHYYLRQQPWEADIQVMLLDKNERTRGSHDIAVAARSILTPLARQMGARIQVVEMPPGPPVLQTVVAEIYGPDAQTRRQVAHDMTMMFEQADGVVDVDNYLAQPYEYWRFEVNVEKAIRSGVTVDTINRNLEMAMGGFRVGDVKRGVVREPTYITLQVPLAVRSQIHRLSSLPIPTSQGESIPLAELGRFVRVYEDPVIYHKDLRPVEYVTGEMEGRLGAPIYGMFAVEELLENYTAPDGVKLSGMPMGLLAPPENSNQSGFEWTGEWTVTYETFRDMGAAFMVALILIYGLIVWEFRNFTLAGLIMAPIPLTLIGIIPGHWIMNAEFTATSMIGFIALAGIIVRNSILLVEFIKHELATGVDIQDAVLAAGQVRMRPILITALTLMAGAVAIIGDPIFQGMAVSLLFGTAVATVLTLIVIPLGCISARKHFYAVDLDPDSENESVVKTTPETAATEPGIPFWLVIWGKTITILLWVFYAMRGLYLLLRQFIENFLARWQQKPDDNGPAGGSTPSGGVPTGGSPAPGGGAATASVSTKSASAKQTPATKKQTVAKTRTPSKNKTASTANVSKKRVKKPAKPKRRGIRLKEQGA